MLAGLINSDNSLTSGIMQYFVESIASTALTNHTIKINGVHIIKEDISSSANVNQINVNVPTYLRSHV